MLLYGSSPRFLTQGWSPSADATYIFNSDWWEVKFFFYKYLYQGKVHLLCTVLKPLTFYYQLIWSADRRLNLSRRTFECRDGVEPQTVACTSVSKHACSLPNFRMRALTLFYTRMHWFLTPRIRSNTNEHDNPSSSFVRHVHYCAISCLLNF